MTEHFPAIVMALSQKVGLTPAKWREENNKIIVHFTTGQKIVFERDAMPTTPAIVGAKHASPKTTPKHAGKKK